MRESIDGFQPKRSTSPDGLKAVRQAAPRRNTAPNTVPNQPLKPGHNSQPRHAARSIDGMVIQPPPRLSIPDKVEKTWQGRPRVGFDKPEFINDPIKKGQVHTKASKFRRLLALLQYPLVAIVAVVAVYSTSIGQWFLLAYAVYALLRRVDSRSTFIAALILLVAIPIFQILNQPGVAENIAVYTYELLVVGTLQSVIELIVTRKRKPDVI